MCLKEQPALHLYILDGHWTWQSHFQAVTWLCVEKPEALWQERRLSCKEKILDGKTETDSTSGIAAASKNCAVDLYADEQGARWLLLQPAQPDKDNNSDLSTEVAIEASRA